MTPILFDPAELAMAAAFVLGAAAVSVRLALGLHRQILWAAARMVVQLLLIGLLLDALFESRSLLLSMFLLLVMLAAAVRETGARPAHRLSAGFNFIASGAGIVLATMAVAGVSLGLHGGGHDVLTPQVLIPVIGIILGTAMNSASIALDAFLRDARQGHLAIEAMLALGHDRHAAIRMSRNKAAQAGLIPTINQMAGAGIITLPGIMSGQVLAGQDPMAAAYAQIYLMFALCGAAVVAICVALYVATNRIIDGRSRLRLERLL